VPDLVLGPLLRYVSDTEATIWVEVDAPCEVRVLEATEPSFEVAGHHYALVRLEGLAPGSTTPYTVELDGTERWPQPGSELPPSLIRTIGDGSLDVRFGSCRVALPNEEPFTHSKDRHEEGREIDALHVLAETMTGAEREEWPDQLFLLGDQVYVDEGSPRTRERIRARRGVGTEPGEEAIDFEEYTWLYHESWGEPLIRWLFSTIAVSMLWDDHDMSDDWNISRSWVEEMRERAWWQGRMSGCVISYWLYQHLGNLSPRALDEDDLYRRVRGAGGGEAGEALRDWAEAIAKTGAGTRWSFCRDLGRTRAIFVDSRAGRTFEGERRQMVDDGEWDWIVEQVQGDFDHLLIATTVPWLLSPSFQALEAWNEKLCAGAWGQPAARLSEHLRREVDFDHWGSFGESFEQLRDLLGEVARGERGARPASVVVLSGDVHHAYLAEVAYPPNGSGGAPGERAPVYQAVCSPYRNPLDEKERRVIRAGFKRPLTAVARALAKAAGAPDPGVRWRLRDGPCFDNQVAMLRIDGRTIEMRLDKTVAGQEHQHSLEQSFRRRLA
jgi:PhoD-like phosphatase